MKNYKVTKKELIKIVNDLDDGLYSVIIDKINPIKPNVFKDSSPDATGVILKKEVNQKISTNLKIGEDIKSPPQKSHKHFDTDKALLSSVKKSISDFVKKHSFVPFVRCELRDISQKYGKMSSFTERLDEDTKLILINTGTFKYKSLRNNQLLLSLHLAECIFREILYAKYKTVDIDRLDLAMDSFYESYYESLSNHKWN